MRNRSLGRSDERYCILKECGVGVSAYTLSIFLVFLDSNTIFCCTIDRRVADTS